MCIFNNFSTVQLTFLFAFHRSFLFSESSFASTKSLFVWTGTGPGTVNHEKCDCKVNLGGSTKPQHGKLVFEWIIKVDLIATPEKWLENITYPRGRNICRRQRNQSTGVSTVLIHGSNIKLQLSSLTIFEKDAGGPWPLLLGSCPSINLQTRGAKYTMQVWIRYLFSLKVPFFHFMRR